MIAKIVISQIESEHLAPAKPVDETAKKFQIYKQLHETDRLLSFVTHRLCIFCTP